MSQNGRHAGGPGDARTQRTRVVAVIVVVGVLALALGWYLGSRGGGEAAAPSTSPASSTTPSPTDEPTPTSTPSPTQEPSPSEEPPDPAALGEGRHFVMAEEVTGSGNDRALVLDLAYFLTGDDANEAAAEHGEETPTPNGYFIVNDNPKLRTVALSPAATVMYIPVESCCDAQEGDLSAWADSVNGTVQSDYPHMPSTWWWVTVQAGRIVAIEQQYLP